MTTDISTRLDPRLDLVSVEAEVLAHLWSRPTDREVDSWRSLAVKHPEAVESLLGSVSALAGANAADLRADYDLRIGGPHAWLASPFESMWRDDVPPRQRWGQWPPAMAALESIYAKLQINPPPSAPADEITVELRALATAAKDQAADALSRALVTEHLSRWLPEFLRAVDQTASEPFYRKLATATARWLNRVEYMLQSA